MLEFSVSELGGLPMSMVTIPVNGRVVLRWAATHVATCAMTGAFQIPELTTTGEIMTGTLGGGIEVTIDCTGPLGMISKAVKVAVI